MFPTLDISATGMHVQTIRLNTIASNMANVDSISSNSDETYRSKQPVFKTILNEETGRPAGGVMIDDIVESEAPNVNVVEEMANMMDASRTYETNIEVMNTTKQILLKTIQMGK
jgi:flagellar basal-body rod protein FlgC